MVGSESDIHFPRVVFSSGGGSPASWGVLCLAFTRRLLWHDFNCGPGGLFFHPLQQLLSAFLFYLTPAKTGFFCKQLRILPGMVLERLDSEACNGLTRTQAV